MSYQDWLATFNPEQLAEIEALYLIYQEAHPTGDQSGFMAFLRHQGWLLPKSGHSVDDLLQTITADMANPSEPKIHPRRGRQHYLFLDFLGEGDTGRIDLVKEHTLQRKVAFKRLKQNSDPLILRRFLNEAQITAQLDHPHIVPIYSLENTAQGLAYTMKRIHGRTFRTLIDEAAGKLPPGTSRLPILDQHQRLDFFLSVCDAVDYAHSRGVIHRELEPSNLMVGNFNEVYVMDWGAARVTQTVAQPVELLLPSDASAEDTEGVLASSLAYLSPEQANGAWETLDTQSDQFALGLILWELLALRPAYSGAEAAILIKQTTRGEVPELTGPQGEKIPADLRAIVAKATALRPQDRYESVSALARDLRRYMRGEAVLARPDTPLLKAGRWLARHQAETLNGVGTIVLLTALFGVWSLWSQQQELDRARTREKALNQFLAAGYQQGRKIDRRFQKVEMGVEGLNAVTLSHLTQKQPQREPYYLHGKFTPPDLAYAPQFQGPVSIDWNMSAKSYYKPEAEVRDDLEKLSPLRHYAKRLLLRSATEAPLSPIEQRQRIGTQGVPITYTTMVLKNGVVVWQPGGEFNAPTYDPLKRPYWRLAAHTHGRKWGNPYVDVSGVGMLLTCATAMYDHQGQFLGISFLDTKFDYIIQALLATPTRLKAVEGSFILDDQGRVVVRSSQKGEKYNATVHPDLKLPPFEQTQVLAAVKANKTGHVIETVNGRQRLTAYYRLHALGWYYVIQADLETALAAVPESQMPSR